MLVMVVDILKCGRRKFYLFFSSILQNVFLKTKYRDSGQPDVTESERSLNET